MNDWRENEPEIDLGETLGSMKLYVQLGRGSLASSTSELHVA